MESRLFVLTTCLLELAHHIDIIPQTGRLKLESHIIMIHGLYSDIFPKTSEYNLMPSPRNYIPYHSRNFATGMITTPFTPRGLLCVFAT